MKKTVLLAPALLLILATLLTGCGALKAASKLEEYKIGDDRIPSITSQVGERDVTGVQSSTKNGIMTQEYTYASSSVYDDLLAYVSFLMDNGWLVTEDIDLNVVPGSGELGRKASEEGQIILLFFSYEDDEYTIRLTKGKGTIE
jgi:hypothetical protein